MQILVSSTVWNTHFETKETEQKHASQVEKHGTEVFPLCLPDTPHPLAHTNTYTHTHTNGHVLGEVLCYEPDHWVV